MTVKIITGDCRRVLATLPAKSINCCVTSPPYFGLRDYGVDGQIGLEDTLEAFLAEMVAVFRGVWRVLRDDGVLWLNLGDIYANDSKWGGNSGGKHVKALHGATNVRRGRKFTGLKPKDLVGMPWRVAFALQADGWYLRQDIIWAKPNPMPESVVDRCTKAHEYVFMLTKAPRYYFDNEAIKEPSSWDPGKSKMPDGRDTGAGGHGSFHRNGREKGKRTDKQRGHGRRHAGFNDRWDAMEKAERCNGKRNKRSVWTIAPKAFKEAHFATFPPKLAEPCILAGCPEGGTVLDPFGGAGTTGLVAEQHKRNAILIEINPDYVDIALRRIHGDVI